jgi:hypothetical protein
MITRQSTLLALASAALATAFPASAVAQQDDVQSWSLVTANISLAENSRWFLYLEAQARLGDDVSRMERLLLRPAVGHRLSNGVDVFLGYAWTPTFMNTSYESDFRGEHRVWQQAVIRHGGAGLFWQHRIRQEQRMIDETPGTSHRTRHLVRASTMPRQVGRIGVTGYHELFITWNSVDGGPRSGFDRSRLFVGPYLTRDHVRYEAGYVGEYGRRFGDSDRILHALLVSANLAF